MNAKIGYCETVRVPKTVTSTLSIHFREKMEGMSTWHLRLLFSCLQTTLAPTKVGKHPAIVSYVPV